jgi:hypothetical protein
VVAHRGPEELHDGFHGGLRDVGGKVDDAEAAGGDLSFKVVANEDFSGQFLLMISFLIVSILLIIKRKNYSSTLILLLISTLTSFVLFSAIFKWQPYGVRLFIPLYCLMSLFLPLYLDKYLNNKLISIISLLFFITSIPYVYSNQNKPLFPFNNRTYSSHENQYFIFSKKINYCKKEDFTLITDKIKSSRLKNVGLAIMNDTWEYPLWVFKPDRVKYFYFRFEPYLKITKNFNKNIEIESIILDINTTLKNNNNFISDSLKTGYLKLYILKKKMKINDLFVKSNEFIISYAE